MMLVAIMAAYYIFSCLLSENLISIAVTLPTFLVIAANVAYSQNRYVSTIDMVWICAYLFFVIAPVQSIGLGGFLEGSPVYGVNFTDGDFIFAGILPFLFFIGFSVATITREHDVVIEYNYVFKQNSGYILFFVCFTFFLMYLAVAGGPAAIYTARYDQVELMGNSTLSTVCLSIFAVSGTMFFIYWKEYRKTLMTGIFAAFCIFLIFLAQNPFNSARYFLMQYYLPIFLIIMVGKIRRTIFFVTSLMSILIIFPILSITSRFGKSITEASSTINLSESFARLQFIDVFDMTAYHLTYWQEPLHFGSKTLGAILFFVPRSIWEGKPPLTSIEIGRMLVSLKFAGTSNLSFFVGDEFYSDFSFPGVLLGGIMIGLFFRYIDAEKVNVLMRHNLTRYFLISAIPIMMRGPIGANIGLVALTLLSYVALRGLLHPVKVSAAGGADLGFLGTPAVKVRPRRGNRSIARALAKAKPIEKNPCEPRL